MLAHPHRMTSARDEWMGQFRRYAPSQFGRGFQSQPVDTRLFVFSMKPSAGLLARNQQRGPFRTEMDAIGRRDLLSRFIHFGFVNRDRAAAAFPKRL